MLLEHFFGRSIQRVLLKNLSALLLIISLTESRQTTLSINFLTTSTPATRSKGEIVCYSCFSRNFGVNYDSKAMSRRPIDESEQNSNSNLTDMFLVLKEGGMRIPAVADRCSDTLPIVNPNFHGTQLKVCPNTQEQPGACVKFKGSYKGEPFIYRECWSRMWMDPRPYQHKMSSNCYNDEMVQNFVGTDTNTICFCEDDLCNFASKPILSVFLLVFMVNLVLVQT